MCETVPRETSEKLRDLSIDLYRRGCDYARERGIILADTKFEFGAVGEEIIVIDEVLTPDSSRYWPATAWAPGRAMPSFDKQPVRDWLEAQDGWDKTPPAPPLPASVVTDTRRRYVEAYRLIAGEPFAGYLDRMGAA
jgi:phosphoribosylaminoimidazole-succinocarboxamide synthase